MIYQPADFVRFSADSQRIIGNLESAYETWLATTREFQALPVSMYWVRRGETDYLSVKNSSQAPGTTNGKRTAETEKQYEAYQTRKGALKDRLASINATLTERVTLYRSLKLPIILDRQAELLRALDLAGKLSMDLMVVGTNAFSAYELHCGARFPTGNEETEDFDLAWCRGSKAARFLAVSNEDQKPRALLDILHSIDSTYQINPKRPYQAVANDGYAVELLAAPSRHPLPAEEAFDPMASFVEQEWLLRGRPISAIVATPRGRAAPLYVPDPRWMALHKLWLAQKPERKASKKEKDARQGAVLLDAVRHFLADTYPLNVDFVVELPSELLDHFNLWAGERNFVPDPS